MLSTLLGWLRPTAPREIPETLWQSTMTAHTFLASLSDTEKIKLRDLTTRFLAEKEFSTAGDLTLTDAMCVAIAAQGCLLVLELGLNAYRDWVGVIVYPDEFVVTQRLEDDSGVVHEFDDVVSGESWPGGPLVVSWQDVRLSGAGYNVVIHEFAHKLDMLSGEPDGIPELHSGLRRDEWEATLHSAYEHFCQRIDRGDETLIDPYAAEHPAEFFAVFTESFFEIPAVVSAEYPAFYQLLARYYRQDPLHR